jgi:hypothetical protein
VTSRAQPSAVLKATTRSGREYWPLRIIGLGFIGLDISATEIAKVIQHDVNGYILIGNQRCQGKHDTTPTLQGSTHCRREQAMADFKARWRINGLIATHGLR